MNYKKNHHCYPKLSVAILSYNRPKELLRCMKSLLPLPESVDVHVFDDCSPKSNEISLSIDRFIRENPKFHIHYSNKNIGYDANLLYGIENSPGDYVFLLSDDDWLEPGCLQSVCNFLSNFNSAVSFVRYVENNSYIGFVNRRDFTADKFFPANYIYEHGEVVYNSILFSGLIFSKKAMIESSYNYSCYLKSIYIQVAIYSILSSRYGSSFISGPGVVVGGDGENGFGLNSSSENNSDLIDRSSVHSNLKFNKRLIVVIERLADHLGVKFKISFYREFNFRNLSGMLSARNQGVKSLFEYWNDLSEVTRYRNFSHWCAFALMIFLPIGLINFFSIRIKKILIFNR